MEYLKERFKRKQILYSPEEKVINFELFDDSDTKLSDEYKIIIKEIAPNIFSLIVYKILTRNNKIKYERDGFVEFGEDNVIKRIDNLYVEFKIKRL